MIVRLIPILTLAVCATSLFADEPRLTPATKVFSGAPPTYKRPRQHREFSMRLSSDGKRVLYCRPTAAPEQAERRFAYFEVVLRELAGGKETVLPTDPLQEGLEGMILRYDMFDRAGTRLVMPGTKTETKKTGEHETVRTTTVTWSIYEIAKGKAGDLVRENQRVLLPRFLPIGKSILSTEQTGPRTMATKIVSLADPKAEPKALSAPGWVQSVNPAGDVAAFFVPPTRPAGSRHQHMPKPSIRLVLWDLNADKEIGEVPTHPSNRALDDWETQWTSDGRYLYYRDLEDVPVEGQDRPTSRIVTRVWDAQESRPAGVIPDAVPVGTGPGRLMCLTKRTRTGAGGILLHDAAAGKEYPLGDASKKLIHAHGGKVIYAEKAEGAETEDVFVADIAVPVPAPKAEASK